MSTAITLRNEHQTFLIETDHSVTLPAEYRLSTQNHLEGIPEGMQPVVDVDKVERNFSDIKDLLINCSNSLLDSIGELKNPKKLAVEFGIKLAGEAGVPMLTKASGEANFKVSIEWERDK